MDMNRSSAGKHVLSDSVVEARQRVNQALSSLGTGTYDASPSKSCVWFIVGCGNTLEAWATRRNMNGDRMSEGKASGILISALERLSLHYGLTNTGRIRKETSKKSFIDGVLHAASLAETFVSPKGSLPRESFKTFAQRLREKYQRGE